MIEFNRFYGGKHHALTMSYDDGMIFDRKLVDIFNKYGIKGTFHLNSGNFGKEGYISKEEVKILYRGHEVACHTVHHGYLERMPYGTAVNEVMNDRKALEEASERIVRGMSYPFGTYNDAVKGILNNCNICYSRTVNATHGFEWPADFLEWNPTCHHSDRLMEITEQFFDNKDVWFASRLFYVWGHSFEFQNDWSLIENFCKKISGQDDIWYATNIEIYDYINDLKRLQITADETKVYNPSNQDLWFSRNGETIMIKAGETLEW